MSFTINRTNKLLLLLMLFFSALPAWAQEMHTMAKKGMSSSPAFDTATFAGGCFWCMEAQFKELKGVVQVVSGFTGGTVANPTYEQVCTSATGHAEAINIVYDPGKISYDELLAAFFTAHDPTELNRQGNDVGTQYRSAIFYHNSNQEKLARYYIRKLDASKAYRAKIVTEVSPFGAFYTAEKYHQDYYSNNQQKPYCQYVIKPKLDKFRMVFKNKLKS
ncbi:peptide-methionine (S)-S-oxide reductase MsrA [Chitinophaga filiformis]|uniref:Peptide methionine sulfoxide reductase MsrA n=1 Tax=Chitinophaga filiformis TaxID=104663 RepID=A0A1G7NZ78_CHIFI|nr:peptide-methionine (S)-S-oxide reductase MsrA [Chitinophaga filiformis]SDF79283.1 peptide-methionine (S)-S-oxide reductase [Chitinophaga filiformis]